MSKGVSWFRMQADGKETYMVAGDTEACKEMDVKMSYDKRARIPIYNPHTLSAIRMN